MLVNFHTHTTYCDGKHTPEEIIISAIEKGFSALGFSEHCYMKFDEECCMTKEDEYISEISALKEKYKDKIEIYLGIEEDINQPSDRDKFEYMISSMHYLYKDGVYHQLDYSPEHLLNCVKAFGGDTLKVAEEYFSQFAAYILKRKPDIVGHFDLITKFDEKNAPLFLGDDAYNKIAEKYLVKALESGCIFEINTGAISRGWRSVPYPAENLLYIMKKNNAKIILSSDSHHKDTLDCHFKETKALLSDIGFTKRYTLKNGKFTEIDL